MNKFRIVHRFAAPLMTILLLVSVITAFSETLCHSIFHVQCPEIIMLIHQGKIISNWTIIISSILMTLIYLLMLFTGLTMFKFPWTKDFWDMSTVQRLHGFFGTFLFSFILLSCLTGSSYSILKYLFGIEEQYIQWILILHSFSFVELTQIFYVHLMLIFVILLIIGGVITYLKYWIQLFKKKKLKVKKEEIEMYPSETEDDEEENENLV